MTFFSVLRRQSHRQSCEGSRRVSRRGLVLTPPWNRGNQAQYVGILALQVKLPHVCVQILMRSSSLRMYLPVPLTCRPSLKSSLISALLSRLEPPARSMPEPGPAQPGPSQPGLALSSLSCPSLNQPQRSQQQADEQESTSQLPAASSQKTNIQKTNIPDSETQNAEPRKRGRRQWREPRITSRLTKINICSASNSLIP